MKRMVYVYLLRKSLLSCFCLCLLVLSGCMGLPQRPGSSPEFSISPDEAQATTIARALEPLLAVQATGHSGVYPLIEAEDALAARVLMARHAERSLDIQYYIWRPDRTGLLLFQAIHEAAGRGVRVRLLLDDNNTVASEPYLRALNSHPNIEVRLFNPFNLRRTRWVNFVTDFTRVNRRMHNKSMTVDGVATIVGGRNIGDEYFGADDDVLFADLDVLAVGEVVPRVSADFDRYWNNLAAYNIDAMSRSSRVPDMSLEHLTALADGIAQSREAAPYLVALRGADLIEELLDNRAGFEWGRVRMVSDDPAKVWKRHRDDELLLMQLQDTIGDPRESVDLVSPYFVPTVAGVEAFSWLARRGVRVRVLTNSLAATDVTIVHSGYAKRRRALLRAGIELYELSRASPGKKQRPGWLLGSSGSSLHAKTFAVDRRQVFVGSFNFDPRSAHLNTELGFVIDSEALAARISRAFDKEIPEQSYRVLLDSNRRLRWEILEGGQQRIYRGEPESPWLRKLNMRLMSILPVEGLL